MDPLGAERGNDIWQMLVTDQALLDATLEGDLDVAVTDRALDASDRTILSTFAAEPDALRWNITNLRYRSSLETMLKLRRWLPLTTAVLTDGHPDWLMDLCYEYLAHHRWGELGHRHFAECLRFVDFVEERVRQRRRLPDHMDTVIQYESAICRMLASTAEGPALEASDTSQVATRLPMPPGSTVLIRLAEDIRAWIIAGRPTEEVPPPLATTILAFVPPQGDTFWATALDDDQSEVFGRCTGTKTGQTVADEVARERGLSPDDVMALLGAWVQEGALVLR